MQIDGMARKVATYWIALAVATVVLAGALAMALVVGRAPVISEWIDDPSFFRRALVVHVVLALWGWFIAYAAGLRLLVDGIASPRRILAATTLASVGVVAIVASAGIRGATPLLVNYIPVVDHPVFLFGLAAFFAGSALILCRPPTIAPPREWNVPLSSAIAWRATSPVAIIAAVVFVITFLKVPRDRSPEVYYEFLFWGVGHTLQVLSILVMLGAWFFLLRNDRGRSPVSPKLTLALCAALIAPQLAAPFLAFSGPTSTYIGGFTRLMQFGIVLPVSLAIVICLARCWKPSISRAGRYAFLVSAILTITGFGLGAMIRGSDTMIPAHYHASLGAITVALMALTFALIEIPGWSVDRKWWRRFAAWQPVIFGVGQLTFAIGFAVSGLYGMDRKAYGSEQVIDSAGAFIGMATMGIGGLMAVFGGGVFIALIAVAIHNHVRTPTLRRIT